MDFPTIAITFIVFAVLYQGAGYFLESRQGKTSLWSQRTGPLASATTTSLQGLVAIVSQTGINKALLRRKGFRERLELLGKVLHDVFPATRFGRTDVGWHNGAASSAGVGAQMGGTVAIPLVGDHQQSRVQTQFTRRVQDGLQAMAVGSSLGVVKPGEMVHVVPHDEGVDAP